MSATAVDPVTAGRAVDAAVAAVAQVEGLMSFHDPASELSRLNRDAARVPQRVHPWTFAVLRRARQVSALSDGLFDATMAPAVVAAGLLPDPGWPAPAPGGWREVRLTAPAMVAFARPLWLDLGGIAKGFAVDVAIHTLRRHGCTEGAVNAGGDLRRFGSVEHLIHLRRDDTLQPVAALRCGAVATSRARAADAGAAQLGVIVDPRHGRPWRGDGTVMVAASNCTIADALTKVAALAGPDSAPLLARFGARGLWAPEGGDLVQV